MGWFDGKKAEAKAPVIPTSPVKYPDGTCVNTETGKYYLSGQTKWKINRDAVFNSWSFPLVCQSSDEAISNYKASIKPLNFRPGTVLRDVFSFELYIATTTGLVPLVDAELYEYLNIDESKITFASKAEIDLFRKEAVI